MNKDDAVKLWREKYPREAVQSFDCSHNGFAEYRGNSVCGQDSENLLSTIACLRALT